MRPTVRGVVVAAVVGAVTLGLIGVAAAKPKKQPVAKYAKTVCGVYSKLDSDYTTYAGSINGLDKTDALNFAGQAQPLTNTFLATLKADEKTLSGVYPDISNGKKVGALIATKATGIDKALSDALNQLPTGGAAGPSVFSASLLSLDAKVPDPFSKVTDQGLINAFQKEKSCQSVLHVVG